MKEDWKDRKGRTSTGRPSQASTWRERHSLQHRGAPTRPLAPPPVPPAVRGPKGQPWTAPSCPAPPLSAPVPVRPASKGSPPAGSGPRRGSGPLLQPQFRRRTGEGRHLCPVLRDSVCAASLCTDTLRGSGARFRPHPWVFPLSKSGQEPSPEGTVPVEEKARPGPTVQIQFSCVLPLAWKHHQPNSVISVEHAVCHQNHLSTCKEADVT